MCLQNNTLYYSSVILLSVTLKKIVANLFSSAVLPGISPSM